ncbi:MAG: hypothetical protein FWC29_05670 [Methanomassiliicoccaceae archaeon]|nr:hypothetical protein [Methanomassiliicoccaceae archaeon]
MKYKLKGDSRGIATLVIVIVAIVIIAGAGATAYVLLSNDKDSNDGGTDVAPKTLGGPGLKTGETLTYAFSANAKVTFMGETFNISDAIKGTFTIKCTPGSGGKYVMTFTMNASYDLSGIVPGMKDSIETITESFEVDSLDMTGFDTTTTDLSDLKDLGYSDADIKKIQGLIEKYNKSTVTLSTVDGSIEVEKRTYSYKWNDLKTLIPDVDALDDIPINKLDVDFSLWFGKDVLYKASVDLKVEVEADGQKMTAEVSASLDLTKHQ